MEHDYIFESLTFIDIYFNMLGFLLYSEMKIRIHSTIEVEKKMFLLK